jgi:hypothetical protein
MEQFTDYIAANYGVCSQEPCSCRKEARPQKLCANWRPEKANSWDEMIEQARSIRERINGR